MVKVRVRGVGKARGVPNIAIIQVTVSNEAKDQLDCRRENNVASDDVVTTLKQVVEENDIYAVPARVTPQHKHGFIGTKVVGYKGINIIRATVRKLELAQELVQQLNNIDEELIQVTSFQFDIEDQQELENLARRAAFSNARDRADVYIAEMFSEADDQHIKVQVETIEEHLSYVNTSRHPSGKFRFGSGISQPDAMISLKDSNDFVNLGDEDNWVPQRETLEMGHIELKINVDVCFNVSNLK